MPPSDEEKQEQEAAKAAAAAAAAAKSNSRGTMMRTWSHDPSPVAASEVMADSGITSIRQRRKKKSSPWRADAKLFVRASSFGRSTGGSTAASKAKQHQQRNNNSNNTNNYRPPPAFESNNNGSNHSSSSSRRTKSPAPPLAIQHSQTITLSPRSRSGGSIHYTPPEYDDQNNNATTTTTATARSKSPANGRSASSSSSSSLTKSPHRNSGGSSNTNTSKKGSSGSRGGYFSRWRKQRSNKQSYYSLFAPTLPDIQDVDPRRAAATSGAISDLDDTTHGEDELDDEDAASLLYGNGTNFTLDDEASIGFDRLEQINKVDTQDLRNALLQELKQTIEPLFYNSERLDVWETTGKGGCFVRERQYGQRRARSGGDPNNIDRNKLINPMFGHQSCYFHEEDRKYHVDQLHFVLNEMKGISLNGLYSNAQFGVRDYPETPHEDAVMPPAQPPTTAPAVDPATEDGAVATTTTAPTSASHSTASGDAPVASASAVVVATTLNEEDAAAIANAVAAATQSSSAAVDDFRSSSSSNNTATAVAPPQDGEEKEEQQHQETVAANDDQSLGVSSMHRRFAAFDRLLQEKEHGDDEHVGNGGCAAAGVTSDLDSVYSEYTIEEEDEEEEEEVVEEEQEEPDSLSYVGGDDQGSVWTEYTLPDSVAPEQQQQQQQWKPPLAAQHEEYQANFDDFVTNMQQSVRSFETTPPRPAGAPQPQQQHDQQDQLECYQYQPFRDQRQQQQQQQRVHQSFESVDAFDNKQAQHRSFELAGLEPFGGHQHHDDPYRQQQHHHQQQQEEEEDGPMISIPSTPCFDEDDDDANSVFTRDTQWTEYTEYTIGMVEPQVPIVAGAPNTATQDMVVKQALALAGLASTTSSSNHSGSRHSHSHHSNGHLSTSHHSGSRNSLNQLVSSPIRQQPSPRVSVSSPAGRRSMSPRVATATGAISFSGSAGKNSRGSGSRGRGGGGSKNSKSGGGSRHSGSNNNSGRSKVVTSHSQGSRNSRTVTTDTAMSDEYDDDEESCTSEAPPTYFSPNKNLAGLTQQRVAEILTVEIWSQDETTVEVSLGILAKEAAMGSANRTRIARLGGVLAVVRAMNAHFFSTAVQVNGCIVVSELAADAENKEALCGVGGPEAVVRAMETHCNNPGLAQAACTALAVLTKKSWDQESSVNLDPSAVATVTKCMVQYGQVALLQESAFRVLANLCIDSQEHLRSLQQAGGLPAMTTALACPWTNSSDKQEAISTLSILLRNLAQLDQ